MTKPAHLPWEEAACYTLTLRHRLPHAVRPSAAHHEARRLRAGVGRLGRARRVRRASLRAASGAKAIGIISDDSKRDYVMDLGAFGVINRKDFNCWGQMPTVNTPEYNNWVKEARKFGKAIWDITGKRDVDIVFEHPGESTFPVVVSGGEARRHGGVLRRHLGLQHHLRCAFMVWMRQKRIQGSHFAHLKQASAANQFVLDRRIYPCMSEVLPWDPRSRTRIT